MKSFFKNEIVKLALILGTISLTVALILSGINAITKDKISAIKAQEEADALKFVMKDATDFTPITLDEKQLEMVDKLFLAKKGGKNLGYCALVSPTGFGGDINIMVGFDNELKVTSVKIISMKETPGLGTKTQDEKFITQYNEKKSPFNVIKGEAVNESDISAVSGATISSKAVTEGINNAFTVLNEVNTKGGNVNG